MWTNYNGANFARSKVMPQRPTNPTPRSHSRNNAYQQQASDARQISLPYRRPYKTKFPTPAAEPPERISCVSRLGNYSGVLFLTVWQCLKVHKNKHKNGHPSCGMQRVRKMHFQEATHMTSIAKSNEPRRCVAAAACTPFAAYMGVCFCVHKHAKHQG